MKKRVALIMMIQQSNCKKCRRLAGPVGLPEGRTGVNRKLDMRNLHEEDI